VPKAYSYLRFSTPEQLKGDSFRRQTEAAQAYAEKHNLALDTQLTFHDMGVSAFRGANAIEGALGKFIEAVDSGRVARGSFMLVENLDRLSRDKIMPALNRFASLLEKGIIVVTLSDGRAYNAESLNNLPELMLSLLVMSRAHEESEMKARRVAAAWQNKRERAVHEGHKLTSKAPAWLRLRNGSFEVLPKRAAIVGRIFEMALAGHGKASIARALNKEGIEPFGDGPSQARKADGWHSSYIQKILRNAAVIGHYQPMRRVWAEGRKQREPDGPVIEGYFPPIVEETAFYRVKRAKPGVSGRNGREVANVLSGLVFCARCGGKLHYLNKGKPPKGGSYLACDNARRKGTCNAKSVRYNLVSGLVFECVALDIRSWVDLPTRNRRQQLQERKGVLEASIAETEQAICNLLDALQRVPSPAIEQRLAQQEATLKKQKLFLAAFAKKIEELNGESSYEDDLRAIQELIRIFESGDQSLIAQMTVRLNAALKQAIDRIEVELTDTKETHVRIRVPNGKGFLVGAWRASGKSSWRFVVGEGENFDEEGPWKGPFAAIA
jgi:DNA invertase Pin-like site-specific DNA recombinase